MRSRLLFLLTLAAFISCNKDPEPIIVSSVTLNTTELTMLEGDTYTLTAIVSPEEADDQTLIWVSSDASVLSVLDGKVTAIKAGSATITVSAKVGGASTTCEVTVKAKNNFLTFETEKEEETNTLCFVWITANFEYSFDASSWSKCSTGNELQFGEGKKLYLRGKDNNDQSIEEGVCWIKFKTSSKVKCMGNIMTLLDYENPGVEILRPYCFINMFGYCTQLTTAPELPATQLSKACYCGMFVGCESLTSAPILPATVLSEDCYSDMFKWCKSLKHVEAMFIEYNGEASGMLSDVSPTGTFTKSSKAAWEDSKVIPAGWTVEYSER